MWLQVDQFPVPGLWMCGGGWCLCRHRGWRNDLGSIIVSPDPTFLLLPTMLLELLELQCPRQHWFLRWIVASSEKCFPWGQSGPSFKSCRIEEFQKSCEACRIMFIHSVIVVTTILWTWLSWRFLFAIKFCYVSIKSRSAFWAESLGLLITCCSTSARMLCAIRPCYETPNIPSMVQWELPVSLILTGQGSVQLSGLSHGRGSLVSILLGQLRIPPWPCVRKNR